MPKSYKDRDAIQLFHGAKGLSEKIIFEDLSQKYVSMLSNWSKSKKSDPLRTIRLRHKTDVP